MHDQDKLDTQARYRKRWLEFGYDPRTLGWNKDCQWVRFEAVFEGLRPEDFASILDVGCGFGDLLVYLRGGGWTGRYIGVDLVPELIDEARRLHTDDTLAEFACQDIAGFHPTQPVDLAVAIGAFNHKIVAGNLNFIGEAIEMMWGFSKRAVVCDFLSMFSDPERREPTLYYAEPGEILAIARHYSRRVMIHHAYMPFEFQVKIWHDDAFSAPTPVFTPYTNLARKQSEWREQVTRSKHNR